MLEHVPHWLGSALKRVRAGADKLVIAQEELGGFAAIELRSQAFGDGDRLPERFTADGAGISPPLFWTNVPEGTEALALVVEDADSPMPQPIVHAVVWGIAPAVDQLAEGAIVADGAGGEAGDVGRNSFRREGWLPPDPPNGHGAHRYCFQLFALGPGSDVGDTPGRGEIVRAMRGRVLAAGLLTGTYSRGEEAPIGPVGAAAPA